MKTLFGLGFPTGRDFLVPEQRDNETSLRSCHGTGRTQTVCQNPGTGGGKGQSLFFCQILGRDMERDRTFTISIHDFLFQNILSSFRTSFPVLECPILSYNVLLESDLSQEVPGQRSLSRDFCSCPCLGTKGHRANKISLSRDKGTMRRPVPWKCQFKLIFK